MEKTSLQVSEEHAASVAKTDNRVTLAQLEEKVESTEYWNPPSAPQLTIAAVKLKNGFVLTGESAPADPANYNKEKGEMFAREQAMRKLWAHAGYALCEKLAA